VIWGVRQSELQCFKRNIFVFVLITMRSKKESVKRKAVSDPVDDVETDTTATTNPTNSPRSSSSIDAARLVHLTDVASIFPDETAAFLTDVRMLTTCDHDRMTVIQLHECQSNKISMEMSVEQDSCAEMCLHGATNVLACIHSEVLHIWNMSADTHITGHSPYKDSTLVFSNDGGRIAVAFKGSEFKWYVGLVLTWTGEQLWKIVVTMRPHKDGIRFSSDDKFLLLAAGAARQIVVFDTSSGDQVRVLAPMPSVKVAVNNYGENNFCAGAAGLVEVWDFAAGERVVAFDDEKAHGHPTCMIFVNHEQMAIARFRNGLDVWNFLSKTKIFHIPGSIYFAVSNPTNNTLLVVVTESGVVIANRKNIVRVVSSLTGEPKGAGIEFGFETARITGIWCDIPQTILL
jgi:hypothetical protein